MKSVLLGSFSTLKLQSRHTANQKIHVSKIFDGVKIEDEDGGQEKERRTVARRYQVFFCDWNRKFLIEKSCNWSAQSC